MFRKLPFLLSSLALIASSPLQSFAADPGVLGATVSPAPATFPGTATFQFQVNNYGSATSNAAVEITISLSNLDFQNGVFDPANDIEHLAGSTNFTWSYDQPTKTFTMTLNGPFPQFAFNTFRIRNLHVLGPSLMTNPTVGGNVNVTTPTALDTDPNNNQTSAVTYTITPTPVTLKNFEGRNLNGQALLNWSAGREDNFREYTVERSTDAASFTRIGTVTPKGSNNSYSFTDISPAAGKNYYRLKMTDVDNTYAYSKTVALRFGSNGIDERIKVYPTVTSGIVSLEGLDPNDAWIIFSSNGSELLQQKAGSVDAHIDLSSFQPGLYVLAIVRDRQIIERFKIVRTQ